MRARVSEGEVLRRTIAQRAFATSRLSAELRAQATSYAQRRAAEGAAQVVIAAELGVSTMSVSRWLRDAVDEVPSATMVPVQVIADAPRVSAGLALVTPSGLRVVGLDLDALCALLARLG